MKNPGRVVDIDLGSHQIRHFCASGEIVSDFLGGRGWNIYNLLKDVSASTDPLSPENIIMFTAGVLTGSKVFSSSRLHVSSISPLTGYLGSSNVGGYLGARLMENGIFSLIVRGKSANPVYIWIESGEVEVRSADHIWGEQTGIARKTIAQQAGPCYDVGIIGPAGENQVAMACIVFNDGHAAGRTGMGAVMGAKNLKAVGAGKGTQTVEGALSRSTAREYLDKMRSTAAYREYSQFGDSTAVKWTDDLGAGTVRNYRQVQSSEIEKADGRSLKDLPRKYLTCFGCPVHCKAELTFTRGPLKGKKAGRPAYEPLVALGPKCGNFDILETTKLHNKCNNLGLDSVEVGGLIAFAMDLYDRGKLKVEHTGGLDLSWGNCKTMDKLIDMIAYEKGFLGRTLGKGLKEAAQVIGGGAEDYAYHVKGLAMTAMDPRGFKGSALGYAIGSRGGDFTSVYARPEHSFSPRQAEETFGSADAADRLTEKGKPELAKRSAIVSALMDSLGMCKIPLLSMVEDYNVSLSAKLASEALGEEIVPADLLKVGKRIIDAERLFNLMRGLTADEDTLPKKFTSEKIVGGPSNGSVVNLDIMLVDYYSLMGWDADGFPTEATLEDMGLQELIGNWPQGDEAIATRLVSKES